ncbi:glutaminase A [Bacillus fonticola]|uniref:glutaminase A n=1 Tax=Bacillus fonticola TaxID=2728853 RepID=UPI00147424D4|nr:glutaminase A [Bacillus fonticola]
MRITHGDLDRFVEQVRPYTEYGQIVEYIPALAKVDPSQVSIALHMLEGECVTAGDTEETFTIQSISKVLSLAYILMERGEAEVFHRVGMEPTGDPFNSIAKLETNRPNKPLNPMINAGALAVTALMPGDGLEERWERFRKFLSALTDKDTLTFNDEVQQSELETADLNRSLAYFLRQHQVIQGDVEELLQLYTRQCSIEMNCQELARIGAVFARDGICPTSGESILPPYIVRICKTFMVTCGMYNASGEFAIKVGIPAKTGVSGGILGIVPGVCGIGVYSPALDEKGNSLAGWKLMELISRTYDFSMF